MDNRPIGVFDSGLGGLTVLREMMKHCPNEKLVYFGDCGRIPYGTKSKETVQKYTLQDINFLLSKNVKAIVIACNTASAYGYELAKQSIDHPVFEVVSPGARAAVRETKTGRIGVIGTAGTISTGVYEKAIRSEAGEWQVEIFSKACPMFVPLVEEGWWSNEIALKIIEEYLLPLKALEIDTLVLGCTHYPILEPLISKVMGTSVRLVSSGVEIAGQIAEFCAVNDIHSDSKFESPDNCEYFTSDSTERFSEFGEAFLGQKIPVTEYVAIEKY